MRSTTHFRTSLSGDGQRRPPDLLKMTTSRPFHTPTIPRHNTHMPTLLEQVMTQLDWVDPTEFRECQRCGNTHADLRFRRLSNPIGNFTHWALCPHVHEPVLLKLEFPKKRKGKK